jgi:hypothetical protein
VLEILLQWFIIDALLLQVAFVSSLPGNSFSAPSFWTVAFFLVVAGQLSAGLIWLLLGPLRWSESTLVVAATIGMAAALFVVSLLTRLPYADAAGDMLLAAAVGAVTHLASTTVMVLFFRRCGAKLTAWPVGSSAPRRARLSLLDLFLITTSAAVIMFAVTLIAPLGPVKQVHIAEGAMFEWIFVPATFLVLRAAMSPRRPMSYIAWVWSPMALLLGILFCLALLSFPNHLPAVVSGAGIVTLLMACYPLTLIWSLEYFRLRGYALEWC